MTPSFSGLGMNSVGYGNGLTVKKKVFEWEFKRSSRGMVGLGRIDKFE